MKITVSRRLEIEGKADEKIIHFEDDESNPSIPLTEIDFISGKLWKSLNSQFPPRSACDVVDFAGILYETYCKTVGGVAHNGDKLPGWKEFHTDPKKQTQVDGWISVAMEALKKP